MRRWQHDMASTILSICSCNGTLAKVASVWRHGRLLDLLAGARFDSTLAGFLLEPPRTPYALYSSTPCKYAVRWTSLEGSAGQSSPVSGFAQARKWKIIVSYRRFVLSLGLLLIQLQAPAHGMMGCRLLHAAASTEVACRRSDGPLSAAHTGLGLAGNEGMEKKMETTLLCYRDDFNGLQGTRDYFSGF